MNVHKHNKKQTSSKVNKRKAAVYFAGLSILLCAIGFGALFLYIENEELGDNNASYIYKEGDGGNYKLVIQYHAEAVAAWKAGDKDKAKALAEEGLSENDNLTIKQQSKVPQQMELIHDLSDIKYGNYVNYEDQ